MNILIHGTFSKRRLILRLRSSAIAISPPDVSVASKLISNAWIPSASRLVIELHLHEVTLWIVSEISP